MPGGVRYAAFDFAYNGRVSLALLPCLAAMVALAGRSCLVTLTIGAMVAYSMDTLQFREGAFACSWFTLVATHTVFAVSLFASSDAPIFLLSSLFFAAAGAAALAGMWASLQFKWIHMQHPPIALLFERCVLTASLPMAAMMHTLGLATLVPVSVLPYYLAVILVCLYACLGVPLTSSFHNARVGAPALGGGGEARKQGEASLARVQSRLDGLLMALITVGLPPALYAAIHWVVLLRHAVHVYSVLLLGSAPLLLLSLMPQGLWWLPGGPKTVRRLRAVIVVLALFTTLLGLEGRVIFYCFGQYIKLSAPWNWVAVTVALYGSAVVGLAHYFGLLGGVVDITVAGSCLLLCTTAGALAAGVSFAWLPAPLVAACGLALFFDEAGGLREYIVFVLGAFLTGVWFVSSQFWFLDIAISGLHLHTVCKLALAALLPALMVPGLMFSGAPRSALGGLLILQAGLVAFLEEQLFMPSQAEFPGETMYPSWLVLTTTAVGIMAARRLTAAGHIGSADSWVLHCIYASKAAMLLLPEAGLVLPTTLLSLSATAPVFLFGAFSPSTGSVGVSPTYVRRVRRPLWVDAVLAKCVLLSVALARFAVFDIVQFLVSARPPEGLLLGALVLVLAAALAPLLVGGYRGNMVVQRCFALLLMTGVLLIVLQPPLPVRGGAKCPQLPLALCPRLWDERHVPLHEPEDVEIWGRGMSRADHWPRWLLLVAVILGAGSTILGGHSSVSRSALARIGLSAVIGTLVGLYIALEVVPHQFILQLMIILSCIVVLAFILLLHRPHSRGVQALPVVAALWGGLCGLTLLLQLELPMPKLSRETLRLFPDSRFQVEDELVHSTRAALLTVFAAQAILLAFALKLRLSSVLKQQDVRLSTWQDEQGGASLARGRRLPGDDLFCGIVPSAMLARFGSMLGLDSSGGGACGLLVQRLKHNGLVWLPTVGNILTLVAFGLCVFLNASITGGAPEAIFMMAPLLLMLSQDPLLLPGLTAPRRYFVPTVAVCAYLALTATTLAAHSSTRPNELLTGGPAGGSHAFVPLLPSGRKVWAAVVQEVVLVALTLPSQATLLTYLWTQKAVPVMTLLVWAPLNLLPLLLSSQPAAQYLSGLCLISAVAQFFSMRHQKHVGSKVV
uniref:Uncharacterized protein n=1 Tax=Dunaliella tertiolecta TaxID=3047 RepID=A0A7S3R236_DUNTE